MSLSVWNGGYQGHRITMSSDDDPVSKVSFCPLLSSSWEASSPFLEPLRLLPSRQTLAKHLSRVVCISVL